MRISLLILATAIWGLGFVGTRWTLIDYDPIWSNSLRFVFAGILSIPYLLYKRPKINLKAGFYCGLVLLIALQLQTIGIGLTTLAKSGFLTTFYAIFTPALALIYTKVKYGYKYWVLVLVALFGISLLCDFQLDNFNLGDMYVLASALFFSIHILCIDYFTKDESPLAFNFLQCVMVGVMGFGFAFIYKGAPDLTPLMDYNNLFIPSALSGFIILSVFSSMIAFSIQVYTQQEIAPHIVSLIFLMESVFSAFFGYLFFQERLTTMAFTGCIVVLLAVGLIPLATRPKKQVETL